VSLPLASNKWVLACTPLANGINSLCPYIGRIPPGTWFSYTRDVLVSGLVRLMQKLPKSARVPQWLLFTCFITSASQAPLHEMPMWFSTMTSIFCFLPYSSSRPKLSTEALATSSGCLRHPDSPWSSGSLKLRPHLSIGNAPRPVGGVICHQDCPANQVHPIDRP